MYKLTSWIFLNVQIDLYVNFWLIINNNITHSKKCRVSGCIFRKIEGVDLHMIQSLGEYRTLILGKMHIRESSEGWFAHF